MLNTVNLVDFISFLNWLFIHLSDIFHSRRHFIRHWLKPQVTAYPTRLTHWMSITLSGRCSGLQARPDPWAHVHKLLRAQWQLRCRQLKQHVWLQGEHFYSLAPVVWEGWGVEGGSWQTYPDWGAGGQNPIFNTAQHPPITTAVPTSLVCPPSGIAGLSVHSSAPLALSLPRSLSRALSPSAHTFLTSVKLLNWSLRRVWKQQFWNYLPER